MNRNFNTGLLCFILFNIMEFKEDTAGMVIFGIGTIGFLILSIINVLGRKR